MKSIVTLLITFAALMFSPAVQAQSSKLKAGDPVQIELKVPAEDAPNVTSKYNISDAGTVKVPYLEREIVAAGLTSTELARRIEAAYKAAEIYTAPTINVTTPTPQDYAPHIIVVGGEVRSGGRDVPLRDGMRLFAAITSAGGFTEFADPRKVKIIRGNKAMIYDLRKIKEDGSNNPILMDGDQVIVPAD